MRKKQLSRRLASAAMAIMMTGSTVAGAAFPSYGAVDPEQDFGNEMITAILGQKAVVNGISVPSSIRIVDQNAVPCASQLYAYLKGVGESPYVLYGHQNDTHHKGGQDFPGSTTSDTKDLTGSISAIVGLDALSFTGAEMPLPAGKKNSVEEAALLSIQAASEGAIMTLSAHMPNFELVAQKGQDENGDYDYSGYSPGNTKGDVMNRILPGGDLNDVFNGYLDLIADYALILQAQNVPVLFRPFHENNGSWFWWGAAFCDEEGYKNVFKYTVEYMRDVRGVHNFLYVYSPGGPFDSIEDYESRYPGDDYVDIVAFDMYHDNPSPTDSWMQSFAETVSLVDQMAMKHGKLSAVAETGMRVGTSMNDGKDYGGITPSGNARPLWFNEIQQVMSPSNSSYYMVWANWDGENNFYSPYKTTAVTGHEMADAFINYYNDSTTIFADGTNFYGQIATPALEQHSSSGYIMYPASGARILYPETLKASVQNVSGNVSFVLKNKEGTVSRSIPAQETAQNYGLGKVYEAKMSQEDLKEIGKTSGTLELVAGDQVLARSNIIYNIKENVLDPLVVDDFEGYLGENALLLKDWSTNAGSGCSVSPELSSAYKSEKEFGMAFNYTISSDGSGEGWAGATKPFESNLSACNALQLWIKPDGKGQKLVIQLTSNGEDFEVHLPEFAATTEAKYVTIPFAAMTGKNGGTFDPANVSSFGIWCNTITPEGSSSWKVDSVLYVDDIHAVVTDAAAVQFGDERISSAGGVSSVQVINNKSEQPITWYGPGYEGMKSLTPDPIKVTTLYSGGNEGKYETSDPSWLFTSKDTDYITFVYNCSDPEKAGWSVLGWGATVNGNWTEGPTYNAGSPNPQEDKTVMVSIKELKTVLGIEHGATVDYLNLNSWNDCNLKSVTLTQGQAMPGNVIVENVPANYTYETNDVGWLVNAPDDKYVNLVITCDNAAHSEWEIMGWGASVGEDWVEGPKYTAWKPAKHEYAVSYSVKRFKELFGVTPERPLTYIKLGSYNDGRIVRLSLDDTRMSFVTYEERTSGKNSGGSGSSQPFRSKNTAKYRKLCKLAQDGFDGKEIDSEAKVEFFKEFEGQTIGTWGQLEIDNDAAKSLIPGSFVVIKYKASDGSSGSSDENLFPSLWPKVESGYYRTVPPVWWNGNYAIFTYDSIASAFSGYLVPDDIRLLALAGGGSDIEIEYVSVIETDETLEDESNVLLELWDNKEYKIADYAENYQEGDEITVTVTLDREIKGNISANIDGEWNSGSELAGSTFRRTFRPDDGSFYVSASDFSGSSYARVLHVRVDISGKQNFKEAVFVDSDPSVIVSRNTTEELAKSAGLTDEEINSGTKLIVVPKETDIIEDTSEMISAEAVNQFGDKVESVSALDISAFKESADGSRTEIDVDLNSPMQFRYSLPENVDKTKTFAVARITEEETRGRSIGSRYIEWLYDLDDNPNTITFETDRLGYFVIVIGTNLEEPAIHTFNKTYEGFETKFSNYLPTFVPGNEVTVTVVFNKKAAGRINGNVGGAWSAGEESTGRAITRTFVPGDDYLNIDLTDMLGNSKVKIKEIIVDQAPVTEPEGIHTFTTTYAGFETTLSRYLSSFKPGNKTTVTVTLDKEASVQIAGNTADGWDAGEAVTGKEVSRTFVPGDDYLNLQLTDMKGNAKVTILSIKVEQEVEKDPEGLHTFTGTYAGFETTLSKYLSSFKPGNKTTITVTLDKEASVQIAGNTADGWDAGEAVTGKEVSRTFVPRDDYLNLQLTDMKGNAKVTILSIKIEQEAEEPVEGIYTFNNTWGTNEDTFTEKLSAYNPDYQVGDKVRITATFDKASQTKLMVNSDTEAEREVISTGKTITLETTPTSDQVQIQAGDDTALPLKLIQVEVEILEKGQQEEPTESIYTFENAWGEENSTCEVKLSDYNTAYKVGDKVRITTIFDKESKVKLMVDSDVETEKSTEKVGKEVSIEVTPTSDKLMVQSGDARLLPLKLTGIKVEILESSQPEEPTESIYTFENAWGEENSTCEVKLSDYNTAYKVGDKVRITTTFDKESKVKLMVDSDVETEKSTEKIGKEVSIEVTPTSDKLMVQSGDASLLPLKLTGIKVEILESSQPEEPTESIYTFENAWGEENSTCEVKLSDYNTAYKVGDKVRITTTFDKESKVKLMVDSDVETEKSTEKVGKEVSIEVTPTSDKLMVQSGDARLLPLKLTGIKVEILESSQPEEPTESIYTFENAWGEENSTCEVKLSDYNTAYKIGDKVRITTTFDKESKVKLMVDSDVETEKSTEKIGKEVSIEVTPTSDKLMVQSGDASLLPLKLTGIKVEILESSQPEEPTESIYTFENAWGEENSTCEVKLSDYNTAYKVGDKVRITTTFDKESKVKLMVNSDVETEKSTEKIGKEVSIEVTPTSDKLMVQSGDASLLPLKLTGIKVEILESSQPEEPTESIYTFENAWGEENSTCEVKLSDYNTAYKVGDKVRITTTFDKESKVKLMVDSDVETEKSTEKIGKEVSIEVTPTSDKLMVQSGDASLLPLKLIKIEVEILTDTTATQSEEDGIALMNLDDDSFPVFKEPGAYTLDLAEDEKVEIAEDINLTGEKIKVSIDLTSDQRFKAAVEETPVEEEESDEAKEEKGSKKAKKSANKSEVFESDKDGNLVIEWETTLESSEITITITQMGKDSEGVEISRIEVEPVKEEDIDSSAENESENLQEEKAETQVKKPALNESVKSEKTSVENAKPVDDDNTEKVVSDKNKPVEKESTASKEESVEKAPVKEEIKADAAETKAPVKEKTENDNADKKETPVESEAAADDTETKAPAKEETKTDNDVKEESSDKNEVKADDTEEKTLVEEESEANNTTEKETSAKEEIKTEEPEKEESVVKEESKKEESVEREFSVEEEVKESSNEVKAEDTVVDEAEEEEDNPSVDEETQVENTVKEETVKENEEVSVETESEETEKAIEVSEKEKPEETSKSSSDNIQEEIPAGDSTAQEQKAEKADLPKPSKEGESTKVLKNTDDETEN